MGERSHQWAPAKTQLIKIVHGLGFVQWTLGQDYCMFSFLTLFRTKKLRYTVLKLIITPFVENRFRDKVESRGSVFMAFFQIKIIYIKGYSKCINNNTNPPPQPPRPPPPTPAPPPPPPPPPRKQPPPKHHYQMQQLKAGAHEKLGLGNELVGGPAHIL